MISKDDEFGGRCRARTKAGKRCRRTIQWLIPICVSRASWLEALRTGWPMMCRGMKSPEYLNYGLCRQHGNKHQPYEADPHYLYGIGRVANPKLDAEYEAARDEGNKRAGYTPPEKRKNVESICKESETDHGKPVSGDQAMQPAGD